MEIGGEGSVRAARARARARAPPHPAPPAEFRRGLPRGSGAVSRDCKTRVIAARGTASDSQNAMEPKLSHWKQLEARRELWKLWKNPLARIARACARAGCDNVSQCRDIVLILHLESEPGKSP
jgi:hypothetical protein